MRKCNETSSTNAMYTCLPVEKFRILQPQIILSFFVTSLPQRGKVILHQKDDLPLLYQKTRSHHKRKSLVPEASRSRSQGIPRHVMEFLNSCLCLTGTLRSRCQPKVCAASEKCCSLDTFKAASLQDNTRPTISKTKPLQHANAYNGICSESPEETKTKT